MRDIIIQPRRIRIEFACWMLCLLTAIGVNIYSIKKYETDWSEMWTQWPVILALSVLFYVLLAAFRIGLRLVVVFVGGDFRKKEAPAPDMPLQDRK